MNFPKVIIASALALMISSCGGGGSGGGTATQASNSTVPEVTRFGSVWLDNETLVGQTTQTFASASFERSEEPIDPRFFELLNVLNNTAQTEGCIAESDDSELVANDYDQALFEELLALAPKEDSLETISAGEFVSIMTPEGSWPAMFQDSTSYEGYQTGREEYKPGAIGFGSTVTFSGAEFPAMTDVALATVPPVLDLATSAFPTHSLKTGDNVTWQNNRTGPNQYAVLEFYIGNLEFNERGYSFTRTGQLRCTVTDSGHFDLPPTLNTLLTNTNYAVGGIRMTRMNFITYQQGDALLSLGATSEAELPAVE